MANENRLIEADEFLDLFYVASAGQDKAFVKIVEMVVEDTPTVDAVEVVRCKDCDKSKRSHLFGSGWRFCMNNSQHHKDGHFCSYGERRE